MKKLHLLGALLITMVSTTVGAVTVGPELIFDPGFDNPSSWDVGIGLSYIDNGHLIAINHTGFIFPEPRLVTDVGTTYQYSLTVDLANNLNGGGKVTVGDQIIWEPGYNTGIFTGAVVATDTAGLVFNFLTPYVGRVEFDSVSIKPLWGHQSHRPHGCSARASWRSSGWPGAKQQIRANYRLASPPGSSKGSNVRVEGKTSPGFMKLSKI